MEFKFNYIGTFVLPITPPFPLQLLVQLLFGFRGTADCWIPRYKGNSFLYVNLFISSPHCRSILSCGFHLKESAVVQHRSKWVDQYGAATFSSISITPPRFECSVFSICTPPPKWRIKPNWHGSVHPGFFTVRYKFGQTRDIRGTWLVGHFRPGNYVHTTNFLAQSAYLMDKYRSLEWFHYDFIDN